MRTGRPISPFGYVGQGRKRRKRTNLTEDHKGHEDGALQTQNKRPILHFLRYLLFRRSFFLALVTSLRIFLRFLCLFAAISSARFEPRAVELAPQVWRRRSKAVLHGSDCCIQSQGPLPAVFAFSGYVATNRLKKL